MCQKRIKNQFDFDTFFDTFSSLKKPVLTWSGESVSKTFVFDTLAGKKKSRHGSGVSPGRDQDLSNDPGSLLILLNGSTKLVIERLAHNLPVGIDELKIPFCVSTTLRGI